MADIAQQLEFLMVGNTAWALADVDFYEAGTTTPVTIYSDRDMTSPVSNPYTLNSQGRSAVVLYANGVIKAKITTVAGYTLTFDNISYTGGATSAEIPVDADAEDFESALEALDKSIGGTINLVPGGSYTITSAIDLPKCNAGATATYIINGNGAKITTAGGYAALQLIPASQTEADTLVSSKFIIKDLTIQGDNTTGSAGIDLGPSYGSVIENCHAITVESGFITRFCLKAILRNCFTTNCAKYGMKITYGNWSGATIYNSPSNGTTLISCRNYCYTGSEAAVAVLACSDVVLRDWIPEGGNPKYTLYFDSESATTVKNITIDGCHLEHDPSIAAFYFKGTGGQATVRGLFVQLESLLFDTSSYYSAPMQLNIYDMAYWPGNAGMFKDDTNSLTTIIGNLGTMVSSGAINETWWDGGAILGGVIAIGMQAGGGPAMGVYTAGGASFGDELNLNKVNMVDGQIRFPSTQNASSNANTLDDYEEGTWTPTAANVTLAAGSPSGATYSGTYTKIGNVVNFIIKAVPDNTTTLAFTVNSTTFTLPFTPAELVSGLGHPLGLSTNVGWIAKTDGKLYPRTLAALNDTIIFSGSYLV